MYLSTVGVPHLILEVADLEAIDLAARGRHLRYHSELGPAGANVNFVSSGTAMGQPAGIRTYERGVEGETLACGTGTVAAGIVLSMLGKAQMPMDFRTRSGRPLRVSARQDGPRLVDLWLGGEGRLVFEGIWPD